MKRGQIYLSGVKRGLSEKGTDLFILLCGRKINLSPFIKCPLLLKVKVIDPESYKVKYKANSAGVFEANLEKNSVFYNSAGHGLVYKNDIWVLK